MPRKKTADREAQRKLAADAIFDSRCGTLLQALVMVHVGGAIAAQGLSMIELDRMVLGDMTVAERAALVGRFNVTLTMLKDVSEEIEQLFSDEAQVVKKKGPRWGEDGFENR
jgi:hypothetical protein